jgi:hypothetical protein
MLASVQFTAKSVYFFYKSDHMRTKRVRIARQVTWFYARLAVSIGGDDMAIKIGDKVTIREAFGTGDRLLVTVSGLGVHKGRQVLDYDGGARWAYYSQIVPDAEASR